jgi:hypothetical protein
VNKQNILDKIPASVHAQMMREIGNASKSHPTEGLSVRAVTRKVFYDHNGKIAYQRDFYNDMPQSFKDHGIDPKTQFLDGDYAEDKSKIVKMHQSSATAHSEFLAEATYDPEIKKLRDSGKYFEATYVNEIPCPRCAACLTLGQTDAVFIPSNYAEGAYTEHRAQYTIMTERILSNAGISFYGVDNAEQKLETIFQAEKGRTPDPDKAHISYQATPKNISETIASHGSTFVRLNPDFSVKAGTIIDGDLVVATACLPTGTRKRDYRDTLKDEEYTPGANKYSHMIDATTALIIHLVQEGIDPKELTIETSNIPKMRGTINALTAGASLKINAATDITRSAENYSNLGIEKISCKRAKHNGTRSPQDGPSEYPIYNRDMSLGVLQVLGANHFIMVPNYTGRGMTLSTSISSPFDNSYECC